MDRLYFQPALVMARQLGVKSPLGILALYDAAVQHGTDDGADGLGAIIERANTAAGGRPSAGVNESDSLEHFFRTRATTLMRPDRVERTAAWQRTTGRVTAMVSILHAGNLNLRTPLRLSPYGVPQVIADREFVGGVGPGQATAGSDDYATWFPDGRPSAAATTAPTAAPGARPTPASTATKSGPTTPKATPRAASAPAAAWGPATGTITGAGGLCVDLAWSQVWDSAPIQGWTCNGSDAQKWTVGTDSTIRAFQYCMSAVNYGTEGPDWRVVLWTCEQTSIQKWRAGPSDSLINQETGLCLHYPQGLLFLDEVGDLHEASQAKLLRVLQDGELQRVGGEQTIKVASRVVSATNRRLNELVSDGRFREDLYYRLNVVPIAVPALRERMQDIVELVPYFLSEFCARNNFRPRTIDPDAVEGLERYAWPGNIRELRNVVERMAILTPGDRITADAIPLEVRSGQAPRAATGLQEVRDSAERERIRQALDQTNWNVSAAARLLETERTALHKRIRSLGLKRQ